MRITTILCLALIGAIAHADATEISDPDTVTYLRAVHNALGTASQAISACASDGGDRQECLCKYEDLVSSFHATVTKLLREHPEVAEYATVNFRDESGGTIAQNIPAMIRQVENPPVCS